MIDYTLPLDQLPDPLPIEPLRKPFDVTITPPGSKSITNRAYVLAALAKGESRIIRPLRADDTDLLLKALCTLGAEARWEGDDVLIRGVNGRFPRGGHVNLGDGGTPTRFMIACACLAAEPVVVDGSQRMRERPIAEGVDMLRQLGAKIEYVEAEGRLPVRVAPSHDFHGGRLSVGRTASSQFISALMLIAPWLRTGVTFHFEGDAPTSESYLWVTRDILGEWGANIDAPQSCGSLRNTTLTVKPTAIGSYEYFTEADASSAVYPAAAALMIPGARTSIHRIETHSPQPDVRCLLLLAERSAPYNGDPDELGFVGPPNVISFHVDLQSMPDGAVAVAIVASRAAGQSRLTGLCTLRVKETDRIAALATELRKVGCEVETGEDWIRIDPRGSESCATDPVVINTYNDHRMAMSFAVLGLARPGISIRNPSCVRKSYPTFWQDFAKLYQ
jgi:3-phosphoshikimate 1-carboxyvinyltransferase